MTILSSFAFTTYVIPALSGDLWHMLLHAASNDYKIVDADIPTLSQGFHCDIRLTINNTEFAMFVPHCSCVMMT